jgi:hypothetical protein
MKYVWFTLGFIFLLGTANTHAHEMTPTYPKLEASYIPGVLKTRMHIFNRRDDVSYYEIGVFGEDWEPIPFVTSYKLLKMDYLAHAEVDIYINKQDKASAEYICSKSKLRKEDVVSSAISSRICSRIK